MFTSLSFCDVSDDAHFFRGVYGFHYNVATANTRTWNNSFTFCVDLVVLTTVRIIGCIWTYVQK